jgi:hypothetical protein
MKVFRQIAKTTVLTLGILSLASAQKIARPNVPDSIKAPADEEVVLVAHASGEQIYKCTGDATLSLGWTFKEPKAQLFDSQGKVIGRHYAGPTWELNDGSAITGRTAPYEEYPDDNSIAWLRINVVSHSGKGLLNQVTTVQRINTKGGKPPDGPCDATIANNEVKSSYTADYYFYAPVK